MTDTTAGDLLLLTTSCNQLHPLMDLSVDKDRNQLILQSTLHTVYCHIMK